MIYSTSRTKGLKSDYFLILKNSVYFCNIFLKFNYKNGFSIERNKSNILYRNFKVITSLPIGENIFAYFGFSVAHNKNWEVERKLHFSRKCGCSESYKLRTIHSSPARGRL